MDKPKDVNYLPKAHFRQAESMFRSLFCGTKTNLISIATKRGTVFEVAPR